MARKLSCLQLFPPFIYLFTFTLLNTTSLLLLLEGAHPSACWTPQVVSWIRGESIFTSEMFLPCCADCIRPWLHRVGPLGPSFVPVEWWLTCTTIKLKRNSQCWNRWIQCYFSACRKHRDSKGFSHLHAFWIGVYRIDWHSGCSFNNQHINSYRVLLIGCFYLSLHIYDKMCCCPYTFLGCLSMWCLF